MRVIGLLLAAVILASCAPVTALRFAVVATERQRTCPKLPGSQVCSPYPDAQAAAPIAREPHCGPPPGNIGGSGYNVHFPLCRVEK